MRSLIRAFVLVSLGLGVSACKDGSSAGTLAADVRWRLWCPVDGAACLDADRDPHAVSAKEGDADAEVICGLIDLGGNERALTMEFADPTGRLLIENAIVNQVGGVVASEGCRVRVWDEGVLFGPYACGPEAPSPTQPCQITTVNLADSGSIVLDDGSLMEGSLLETTVYCLDIQDQGKVETRHLASPDSAVEKMPVPIKVVNCDQS